MMAPETEGPRGGIRRRRPFQERLDLTEDLVRLTRRETQDPGPDGKYREITDEEIHDHATRLIREAGEDPIWVFAYGSLIWKPAFDFVDRMDCRAFGWRRAFCLNDTRWRASAENPGLIMCLDHGGSCHGLAYRLPDLSKFEQMLRFVDRECGYEGDYDYIRWIPVMTATGTARALVSWVAPHTDPEYLRLPIGAQAARLARAVGHLGSGAEYLRNTILHLEELGIHDSYLWRLQKLVAAEIRRLHASPRPPVAALARGMLPDTPAAMPQ